MRMLVAFALTLAVTPAATAQEFRGAITGRVNDRSGGVLPGVTITATNVATNIASTTTTNQEGLYTIPYLTPGRYTVVAELSGFKKSQRDGLDVRIGDRLVVDVDLEVGQLEETVLVTAQSPLLEMGSASQGQVIDEKRQKRAEARAKRAAEAKKAMEEAESQAQAEGGAPSGEEGKEKE